MRIEWSLFAINDREAIFDYIEADSPRAAAMVDNRIEAQIEGLIRTPEMGRMGRIALTRELVVSRTPYIAATGSKAIPCGFCVSFMERSNGRTT